MKQAKPKIIAVAAATIDGKIAINSSHFTDWTSPEDKEFLHNILETTDVIIVGRNTHETAREQLSRRNCIVFTSSVAETEQRAERLLYCNPNNIDVRNLLSKYATVAVLGGTQTYTYFFEHKMLDELYLTIEPLVFGGGLNIFDGEICKTQFHLLSMKRLNAKGSILLHYKTAFSSLENVH